MESNPRVLHSPISILIVDDEKELATLYKEFVIRLGYEGVSFTDPLMAFEHYKKFTSQYPLVMTDLRMPGMCGLELANRIRMLNPSVKIFLMTAFDIADVQNPWASGVIKFDRALQKPLKLSELKKAIEQDIIQKPKNI